MHDCACGATVAMEEVAMGVNKNGFVCMCMWRRFNHEAECKEAKMEERSAQKLLAEQERMGQQLSDLAKREDKAQSERERYTKELKERTAELEAEKEMLSKRWAERSNMDRKQLVELR